MAVNLSPVGGVAAQFFDNSGNVLTGGKIYTYSAGTTTDQATYTSSTGTTFHSNPIILDASGRVPGGEIWLADNIAYKFVIEDSNNVLIGTYDNIVGINSNFLNFYTQEEIQTATAGQTVFTLSTVSYTPGTNSLSVFVDGVNQYDGSSYAYVETDSTTITFTAGLHVGALVKFTTAISLAGGASNSSTVIYDPAGIGAVATTVQAKLRETVSIKDFGATGNGTTDDTTAIQNAINATASGGRLYIPTGNYLVTSGLVANVSMNIIGEGWSEAGGSRFIVSSLMSGTTDVLTMNGYISGAYEGVTLSDFSIVPQSGTPARYGINLGNAKGLNRATIERIKIGTLGTGSILNNGAFSSTIQNCLLNTGIWFNKGTDNQNVLNNTISGAGYGIYVDCVAGSNMFNIEGNVIVNTSGGVYIQNAGTMTIANNQFEQQVASDTAESTIIYALGNPRQIESLQIYGNNFNTDPTLVNYSITLQNTQSVCIYNNHFSGALPYPKQAIAINSSSYSARIYGNYIYGNNTGATADSANQQYNQIYDATYFPEGRFSDLGIGTCGLWKLLSYAAYPDVTANASYSPLSIKKSEDNNQVFFRGGVNVANPVNGKTIVAIPTGFKTQNNVIMSTMARIPATGVFIPITLYINYATQTIVIHDVPAALASIELSFEGCSYFYYFG